MSSAQPDPMIMWSENGDLVEFPATTAPALNPDGTVNLLPADGTNIVGLPVKYFSHHYVPMPEGESLDEFFANMEREKIRNVEQRGELVFTDARLIMLGAPKDGGRFAAHLWYPWISLVSFAPKQGLLSSPVISLDFMRDLSEDDPAAAWSERIELEFDKDFHPATLARDITRRICTHHLHNDPPVETRDQLAAGQNTDLIPDPPKNELAMYTIPCSVEFPGGIMHVPEAEPTAWEWTVHRT